MSKPKYSILRNRRQNHVPKWRFSVTLSDDLCGKLVSMAEKSGKTTNSLIGEALRLEHAVYTVLARGSTAIIKSASGKEIHLSLRK